MKGVINSTPFFVVLELFRGFFANLFCSLNTKSINGIRTRLITKIVFKLPPTTLFEGFFAN